MSHGSHMTMSHDTHMIMSLDGAQSCVYVCSDVTQQHTVSSPLHLPVSAVFSVPLTLMQSLVTVVSNVLEPSNGPGWSQLVTVRHCMCDTGLPQ